MNTPDRLKPVGLWVARQSLDTSACVGWIHPRHLKTPGWRPHQRQAILAYLSSGAQWAGYRGRSTCRFDDCTETDLGSTDQTDGVWVWPEGLAHYVEAHDVRLPDAFTQTMIDHGFEVPGDAKERRKEALDGEPWLRWSARQVPDPAPQEAATIEQARQLAEELSAPACQVSITEVGARWLVALKFPGPQVVEGGMTPALPTANGGVEAEVTVDGGDVDEPSDEVDG